MKSRSRGGVAFSVRKYFALTMAVSSATVSSPVLQSTNCLPRLWSKSRISRLHLWCSRVLACRYRDTGWTIYRRLSGVRQYGYTYFYSGGYNAHHVTWLRSQYEQSLTAAGVARTAAVWLAMVLVCNEYPCTVRRRSKRNARQLKQFARSSHEVA